MQEVFSKPDDANKPPHEREFWELCLFDSPDPWRPGFIVEQSRAFWSEIDGQFMYDEVETERWRSLLTAEERYEARRLALVKRGLQSDMDI
jgi:hypothetical protein